MEEKGTLLNINSKENSESQFSKNTDVILDRVKKGERMSKLVATFTAQYAQIAKLMQYRPKRMHKTALLYLWGPTGVGKTTMVYRVLKALQNADVVDYYSKGGGLKRYWDGYDNQEIAWIDDPVSPDIKRQGSAEDVQQLKNVMSVGDCYVEIKYGNMVFDSKLLIITSNIDPETLSIRCGEENREPIYRRLTDTCGAFWIDNCNPLRYRSLCEMIKIACNKSFDTKKILDSMDPLPKNDFADAAKMMRAQPVTVEHGEDEYNQDVSLMCFEDMPECDDCFDIFGSMNCECKPSTSTADQ